MTTSYSVGDPIRVIDADGEAYGIVVGHVSGEQALEVQFLERGVDRIYRVGSSCYHVPAGCVAEHQSLGGDDGLAPQAFDALGFRMLDGSSFVRHADENDGHLFPVGDEAFDLVSDDEGDPDADDPTLGGFIVPDDECEPFTEAAEDCDFVRETHAAVRAFNGWVPQDEQQSQARTFIQRQEARAAHVDDEARFAKNIPATGRYSNPGSST